MLPLLSVLLLRRQDKLLAEKSTVLHQQEQKTAAAGFCLNIETLCYCAGRHHPQVVLSKDNPGK